MKIISLNIWGGRVREDFIKFITKHADDTDIFCFQEVYKDAVEALKETEYAYIAENQSFYLLKELLPNHELIFNPAFLGVYGVCLCIKKSIQIQKADELFIYKEKGYLPPKDEVGRHGRNLQYAQVQIDNESEPLTIINLHALWNGQGKSDTDERIEQSQRIVNFIKQIETKIILCGDFNLRPDTKSISMIEEAGLKNLIKEYDIASTRTSLYNKEEKHADYIFTSPEITVKKFEVLPDEVSDHAPLILEV
jgi:endonuclease/exonuclease/phosphatase family metal-dependent hydrolase